MGKISARSSQIAQEVASEIKKKEQREKEGEKRRREQEARINLVKRLSTKRLNAEKLLQRREEARKRREDEAKRAIARRTAASIKAAVEKEKELADQIDLLYSVLTEGFNVVMNRATKKNTEFLKPFASCTKAEIETAYQDLINEDIKLRAS